MNSTPQTTGRIDEDYCVSGDCHTVATHLVTHLNAETDQVIWVYAVCKFHVPTFLMGHRENVRATFAGIAPAIDPNAETKARAMRSHFHASPPS
jgi:hypothetical protein